MTQEVTQLIERLNRRTPSRRDFLYGEEGAKLVNPDGPDAAAALTAAHTEAAELKARVEALEKALRPFAKMADDVEELASKIHAHPDSVVKSCAWADLLSARQALGGVS